MSKRAARDSSSRASAVLRWRAGAPVAGRDLLAVEAPLEIRFDDRPFTVLMRTPGHDEELVRGFLFAEGIIDAATAPCFGRPDSLLAEDCENRIDVAFAGASDAVSRTFPAVASCGVCGKASIEDLVVDASRIESDLRVPSSLLVLLPERLGLAQPGFDATGGLHAAGLFTAAGELLVAREDVGRHNAVDKVIGWALGVAECELARSLLVVTSRLGFEIVQKAIVAGIPILAGVGAASSLAVDLAESHGLTLASFVKPESVNLFGEPGRIVAD